MSEMKLGCHCDLEPGQQPTGCVFDGHDPVENCSVAMRLRAEGKTQEHCEHWRPIQPSEVEQLRAEVSRLRLTDAEREALDNAAQWLVAIQSADDPRAGECAATLRALLARLGGEL